MSIKHLAAGIALVILGSFAAPNGAIADAASDQHVMVFNGTSTLALQCEYEWMDADSGAPGLQPERDDANIPRPVMYSDGPRCRDGSPGAPGVQVVTCSLARNTGIRGPYDRPADPTKGETALYPPCMGKLTATDNPGEQGCHDTGLAGTVPINGACNISTPGWFYGYCGQTYGGGANGRLTTADGKVWRIDRLGFARGRGSWEVSGKITLMSGETPTNVRSTYRNTVNAAPNKLPDQGVACEVGQGLTSIIFAGVLVMPAPPLKAIRPKPGWHWCADDPTIGATTEGC